MKRKHFQKDEWVCFTSPALFFLTLNHASEKWISKETVLENMTWSLISLPLAIDFFWTDSTQPSDQHLCVSTGAKVNVLETEQEGWGDGVGAPAVLWVSLTRWIYRKSAFPTQLPLRKWWTEQWCSVLQGYGLWLLCGIRVRRNFVQHENNSHDLAVYFSFASLLLIKTWTCVSKT